MNADNSNLCWGGGKAEASPRDYLQFYLYIHPFVRYFSSPSHWFCHLVSPQLYIQHLRSWVGPKKQFFHEPPACKTVFQGDIDLCWKTMKKQDSSICSNSLPGTTRYQDLQVSQCFSKLEEFQRCSEQQLSEFRQATSGQKPCHGTLWKAQVLL